jgi:hypothetical protein
LFSIAFDLRESITMIRFESSEASASRTGPNAAKGVSPAPARAVEPVQDEAFALDGVETADEKGTDDRKARGRSRKMRG